MAEPQKNHVSLPDDQMEFLWKWSTETSIRHQEPSWNTQNIETYQSKLKGVTINSLSDEGISIKKLVMVDTGLTGTIPNEIGSCTGVCLYVYVYHHD